MLAPLLVAIAVLAVVLYLVVVVAINRRLTPRAKTIRPEQQEGFALSWSRRATVTTWNVGYAGLGASSDFITDGGRSFLPPSRSAVESNLQEITETLHGTASDVVLLQEVADSGMMTRWVDVRRAIVSCLGDRRSFFRPDVASRGIPWPLATRHGTLMALRSTPETVEIVPLPAEPTLLAGYLKRQYALQVCRVPIDSTQGQWVFANLHLSAFDDNGATRAAQLATVLQFATKEFAAGNFVVIGGDWNMVLADPGRPSTTIPAHLFWIVEFPRQLLPKGWTIAVDTGTPTVRTLYQPYKRGENFVTAVDGFLVSPNVGVERVKTFDNDFSCSDHMPQTATFIAR